MEIITDLATVLEDELQKNLSITQELCFEKYSSIDDIYELSDQDISTYIANERLVFFEECLKNLNILSMRKIIKMGKVQRGKGG